MERDSSGEDEKTEEEWKGERGGMEEESLREDKKNRRRACRGEKGREAEGETWRGGGRRGDERGAVWRRRCGERGTTDK